MAIKILDKSKLDVKTQKMLTREIYCMEKLHHPNLVRLFEVIETFSKVYLVLEYAANGELAETINERGRFKEPAAALIFAQIVSAIDHMVSVYINTCNHLLMHYIAINSLVIHYHSLATSNNNCYFLSLSPLHHISRL